VQGGVRCWSWRWLWSGPCLSEMSLHEWDRDRLQSFRYVEHGMDVDLEDHAAVLGGEIDATEGQAQRSRRGYCEAAVLRREVLGGDDRGHRTS
jgi:hypothetical protein